MQKSQIVRKLSKQINDICNSVDEQLPSIAFMEDEPKIKNIKLLTESLSRVTVMLAQIIKLEKLTDEENSHETSKDIEILEEYLKRRIDKYIENAH